MNAVLSDDLAHLRAELREAQAALDEARAQRDRAREQAAQASRQRYAFLSGLAHDLRNPLAPLSNGIELLRLTDADPAGRLRTRSIMERQIAHLMRIADELSDLARLASGDVSLQDAPFALGALLRAFGDERGAALHAQGMELQIDAPPAGAPSLRGDAQRIAQAIGRLVDDVARHAERGSVIRMTARCGDGSMSLTLGAAADLDADPASDHALAAQPAAANDEDGAARPIEDVDPAVLGLGVSLARQLVVLHGGELRVQRRAGARRARFTLTLPVDPEAAAASPPDDFAPPRAA